MSFALATCWVAPESTRLVGEFTAAMASESPNSVSMNLTASASLITTDSIAPSSASSSVALARVAISPSADSRLMTPATTTATYSPIEWPAIATGRTPNDMMSRASAYSVTKIAGCVIDGRENLSCDAATSSANSSERRSTSSIGHSSSQHWSKCARYVSFAVYRWRPIDRYCEPCPGNTNATAALGLAVMTAAASSAVSELIASALLLTASATRSSKCSRPTCSVCATSPSAAECDSRYSRSCATWRSTAARDLPETTSSSHWSAGSSDIVGSAGSISVGRGCGSASTQCALVPPMPNEETPHISGFPSTDCQSSVTVLTKNGVFLSASLSLGLSKCAVRTSLRCFSMSTALMNPVMPAAQFACAMLPLIEPSAFGCVFGPSAV